MRLLLSFFFCAFFITASAQRHSRTKIILNQNHTMHQLAEMGLDVDHGYLQPNQYFINEFSQNELIAIQNAGFEIEIMVADVIAHRDHLQEHGNHVHHRFTGCDGINEGEYETPENYTYGSMGGYYYYQEMLDLLDEMKAKFPDLITVRASIDSNNLTHEGRHVFFVKISDNPEMDEDEPELLYDAVHHAREPNSMSQVVFYMWYLLEHYDDDDEIKYLVDNTEMYFVPCVNPDGYIKNEVENPNGGGFWRKNLRDNGDGTVGVDLNRNYDYLWAYDNNGSSPATGGQTYRGPEPFSEPETKAMKTFCEAHEFQIALNCHTYSNLLIHPWDYDDEITPDHETFQAFGKIMTRKNDYRYGISVDVLYPINGGVNDWMYGEQSTKNKIYSFLPEVGPGSFGFWPPQNAIDGLNKDAIHMNLMAAHLTLNYGELQLNEYLYFSENEKNIPYTLTKYGLGDGDISVSIQPVSSNVILPVHSKTYQLDHLEKAEEMVIFDITSDTQHGDTLFFKATIDNGGYIHSEQFYKIYQENPQSVFFDEMNDLAEWAGTWGVTSEDYFSPSTCITDSPNALYSSNEFKVIKMSESISLTNPTDAILSFHAKWNVDEVNDYVQVFLELNGTTIPLCGKYSVVSDNQFAFEEPVYVGSQNDWVREEIDLMEYIPSNNTSEIRIGFRIRTGSFIEMDGFYFDDLNIDATDDYTVAIDPGSNLYKAAINVHPNPAHKVVHFEIENTEINNELELTIYSALGEKIMIQSFNNKSLQLNISEWNRGVYYYDIMDGRSKIGGKFLVE